MSGAWWGAFYATIPGSGAFGGAGGCNSFTEDTPVATIEGQKPIGELKIGDRVLARSEETGAYAFEPITQVFRHKDPVKVHLTLEDLATGATEVIETTPEHPFHVPGRGFVEAVSLTSGDWVSRAPSAEPPPASIVRLPANLSETSDALRVRALSFVQQPFWAHNLEVAGYHTFFVGASRAWVHNGIVPCPIITKLSRTESDSFRQQATKTIWPRVNGRTAGSLDLDVHHRIPLEWSHLFSNANPNRVANLIGLPGRSSNIRLPGIQDPSKMKSVHDVVNEEWSIFKKLTPNPTASDVMKKALEIDQTYRQYYR
jgi:hypothetical protein